MIVYGISDIELHNKLTKYYDPGLMHTCINVMLITRAFSLFCCAMLFLCVCIFIAVAVISGSIPKAKYMDKIPAIKKFIDSKSR